MKTVDAFAVTLFCNYYGYMGVLARVCTTLKLVVRHEVELLVLVTIL